MEVITNAFWIGTGNDSNLIVDKILSIAQAVRTNVTDYVNDGMGGTFTNISTNDETGTIVGVTAATELENYASGDYRLKASGSGNGAFKQAVGPSIYSSDVAFSWPVISAASSQSSTMPIYI